MWKPWQYRHVDGRKIINTWEKEEGIKQKWITGIIYNKQACENLDNTDMWIAEK